MRNQGFRILDNIFSKEETFASQLSTFFLNGSPFFFAVAKQAPLPACLKGPAPSVTRRVCGSHTHLEKRVRYGQDMHKPRKIEHTGGMWHTRWSPHVPAFS